MYLWRRRIVAPERSISSADACEEWINEVVEQPAARIKRKQLTHCVWTDGLQLGGGGLTPEKARTLDEAVRRADRRKLFVRYVEGLSQFTPPIYVGQTGDLRARVGQHLKGDTQLYSYVRDTLALAWEDLDLRYLQVSESASLSDESRVLLELLELITQRVLAPFGTERPG